VVTFTISGPGTYSTTDYIDENGYVRTQPTQRCYAAEGGHYYWIEEFLRPGSNPLDPTESDYIQPKGEGKSPEDITILPPTIPEVTTDADVVASVNAPFRDTAVVEGIPAGNGKTYKLWFTAYGPVADGQVNCTDNLIYSNESMPINVTQNGEYYSEYITVSSNGLVYWIEHLADEDGNIVDEGMCGIERETTYIVAPPPVENHYEPFQVIPLYPDAGYLARQVSKILAFAAMSILGAWQLTNRNSWLLSKRK
jgi:hypothetical protein